ncbi:IS21 family transposase [Pseudofrankia sp. BMG5.36]|uniref:IS21 family transposase n=2 Tax=unclassified Pseudofrankia TaxID=2994372 RepID=UPI0008D91C89|nr:transposase [Pseudofrankia sp. BMG5.36]
MSIRELAERHGVHRRTVRQALESAAPVPRRTPVRVSARLETFKAAIDAMLVADLDAPRKQRHTARRVRDRLVAEDGMSEAVAYSTVRDYVARRRPEIAAEAGRGMETAFVLQTHLPGQEAEVDFGDLWVLLSGVQTKCFLFTLRLSYSGKAVHRVFASQGQEAFIEGHLHAFTVLGGVPAGKIRYDNLRSAVSRVLLGRNRTESDRWVLFRSHFGFDAFYCLPGVEGAHEKGGVEGEVGRFRRNHLVPVPEVDTLAELNGRIEQADLADDGRRIEGRLVTVGQAFAAEVGLLRALPEEAFEPGLLLTPRVDRYGQVTVRQCHYSVPVRLIGQRVRVFLRASELVILDGRVEVARHTRAVRKGSQSLLLDHYLEVLARKPGALPGATALVQARASGMFTPAHDAFWAAARRAHGDSGGTRALVEVLLLHRHLSHPDVVAGLTAAVATGASTADVVAVEARKATQARRPTPAPAPTASPVVSLTARRLAGLPPDSRPAPSVAHYDQLLRRRAPQPPAARAPPPASEGEMS